MNEIMLNIMQNFEFEFLKNEFWFEECTSLISISRTSHNFSPGFFSMYRGMLEIKPILAFYAKMARSQIRPVAP